MKSLIVAAVIAFCLTAIVIVDVPPAIEMVAVLSAPLLASAVTLTVIGEAALPLEGLNDSHDASEVTVQSTVELNVICLDSPAATNCRSVIVVSSSAASTP